MPKDLLDCTVGKCMYCKKLKILANGMCGACLKDLTDQEQDEHESGVDWDSRNEDEGEDR